MATIIHSQERDYQPYPGRIDGFRLLTDMSRQQRGINPQWLEEMFLILEGRATLRTPQGLTEVVEGDIIFFEAGETGAHQLYNPTDEPCTYLDLRSHIGYDVCEYPDSDKLILIPGADTFRRRDQPAYFDGEENVDEVWRKLREKD